MKNFFWRKKRGKNMKKKVLLVIDMQNDFLTGALANEEGQKIIGAVKARIEECKEEGYEILFTRDTHGENYMETQEGEKLPVPHCIEGSEGWQITDELLPYTDSRNVLDKPSFGSLELPRKIMTRVNDEPVEIELCGVCTDICVISNAMILKAAFPETPVKVNGNLCAGVTPESHATALEAMKMCQVEVI